MTKRVMLNGPPPWAPSGYGVQMRLTGLALRDAGFEVALSCYAGCHEEREWNGLQILNGTWRPYGNSVLAGNARRWGADAVILISDAWAVEPTQLAGLTVFPWMPVDAEPLGEVDKLWLKACAGAGVKLRPVAMSQFGQRMLAGGWPGQVPLVYHGIDTAVFRPDAEAGKAWRRQQRLPADAYLISIVGVNDSFPGRKNFVKQLEAFALFAAREPKACMYLHTEPQCKQGPNLAKVALSLGLKGRVAFADEEDRAADRHDEAYMVGMLNASHQYTQCSLGEGFGIPAIEAMACGVPVVATKASAQAELVPAACGKLVPGERIWSRLHDSWWRQPAAADIARAWQRVKANVVPYGPACRRQGERFDYRVTARGWLDVLGEPG